MNYPIRIDIQALRTHSGFYNIEVKLDQLLAVLEGEDPLVFLGHPIMDDQVIDAPGANWLLEVATEFGSDRITEALIPVPDITMSDVAIGVYCNQNLQSYLDLNIDKVVGYLKKRAIHNDVLQTAREKGYTADDLYYRGEVTDPEGTYCQICVGTRVRHGALPYSFKVQVDYSTLCDMAEPDDLEANNGEALMTSQSARSQATSGPMSTARFRVQQASQVHPHWEATGEPAITYPSVAAFQTLAEAASVATALEIGTVRKEDLNHVPDAALYLPWHVVDTRP